MTTHAELQRLIELSVADPRREPDFLRALLDATLYVHLPFVDDAARLRLMCFTRPDGLTVIPVFTALDRAARAARSAARVESVRGRELFEGAPGATFMIDPNDTSTTLYPEEIAALLKDGAAAIAPRAVPEAPLEVSPAEDEDDWLRDLIRDAITPIPEVVAIHLVHMHLAGLEEPTGFLAVVSVPRALSERVARTVALAIDRSPRPPRLAVDLCTYEPTEPPEWSDSDRLRPFWVRTVAAH